MPKKIFIIIGSILLVGLIFYCATTYGMSEVINYVMPDIDMSQIADGRYEGSCDISRWALDVRVTVKGHKIVAVEITDKKMSNITEKFIDELNGYLIDRKFPDFDAVTAASITGKTYLIAVADALHSERN
ncbi:MAG: FMN-binding protein [Chitinivibrionales bacterium]|nr:FMN-binding protein [Chitinivibrionales bacterium]